MALALTTQTTQTTLAILATLATLTTPLSLKNHQSALYPTHINRLISFDPSY